ncbi:MAG TPA: CHAT domain-containing protein [Thermoanaerobaculia bacterium]|nr:CHAT domain-containing protein [Thermoanaerobaculia bacterium]
MATRRLTGQSGWTLVESRVVGGRRRGAAAEAAIPIPSEFLQSDGVRVDKVLDATPPSPTAERRASPPDLVVKTDLLPGESAILAIRHPSGALTFHPSTERVSPSSRRGTAVSAVAVFRVPMRRSEPEAGRRGVVAKALKAVVIKIAKAAIDKAVSIALPILAARWEAATWKKRGISEGWFKVTPAGANGLTLMPGVPAPDQRTLLLLHGTFSNANGGFGSLAGTDFFDRVRPLYEDRICAFNHFSISRTPEENARQIVEGLPAGEHLFDVITHSRGGLVLRNLVERKAELGPAAERFRLRHAVLVASPNDGTPLATPTRWEQTVGWFANLMEFFPVNPFTTGAAFVSEALVWLASHAGGDLPGLRSMDGAGQMVADLQSPPAPPNGAYSALVSNYQPAGALWQRALDVGVDAFFASANDLVVPSEGGWRVDHDGTVHIPGDRIGCFGPGGNIVTGPDQVNHINFFGRAETAKFLATALAGQPHHLPPIDPNAPLPDRRFKRGVQVGSGTRTNVQEVVPESPAPASPEVPVISSTVALLPAPPQDDTDAFHIMVIDDGETQTGDGRGAAPTTPKYARVLASYAGARVMTRIRLRADEGEEPTAFGKIIGFHERVKKYTNEGKGTLPTDDEMVRFGGLLFETLFQGDVRRLYDEARTRQRLRKLDLVLTSMIPWIAEKPWEFCYDSARASFLATEEIHFVRNVLTVVPADTIERCDGPLRILVASAQPVSFGLLSIDQEVEVIRRGFQPLIDAGLVSVDILPRATPEAIHRMLEARQFRAVHFIGHGEFDEQRREGCLVFEDSRGGAFRLGQRSVREIFCGRGLSLVFLNSCQSGAGGRSDFNKGVAQSLVAHGLPALVANQYSVLDSSATSFAQYFYSSLGQGHTLGHAAREARIAVNYSLQGELIDWAVPVLYARDANSALCTRAAGAADLTPVRTSAGARRAGAPDHARRVAVWDVDMVLPALERTLDRMNRAQDVFGFELTDMSAPLDAWDYASDGRRLSPEHLADRLRSKTVELHVDLLVCITRHPLSGTEKVRVWWPDGRTPSVAVLSFAGLKLEAEGQEMDRFIATALASMAAGFFGGVGVHTKGAKECPLAFDVSSGSRKFDASCRAKLKRQIPHDLPALDALLKVFR